MTRPVRVAGFGIDTEGRSVTWTVSEGSRGRRWREVVAGEAGAWHGLLLETGRDRRLDHVEIVSPAGLWTFHPEPDGTLHGNGVGAGIGRVRHVEGWPFGPETLFVVEGSTIGAAAIAWRASDELPVGARTTVPCVLWRSSGDVEPIDAVVVERRSETVWRIADAPPFSIDARGLPVLHDGATHPLERD